MFSIAPGPGREYKSKKAAVADFDANLLFRDHSFGATSGYVTKSDIARAGGGRVEIRFAALTKFAIIDVKGDDTP